MYYSRSSNNPQQQLHKDQLDYTRLKDYREKVEELKRDFEIHQDRLQEKTIDCQRLNAAVQALLPLKNKVKQLTLQREQLVTELRLSKAQQNKFLSQLQDQYNCKLTQMQESIQQRELEFNAQKQAQLLKLRDLEFKLRSSEQSIHRIQSNHRQKIDSLKEKWQLMKKETLSLNEQNHLLKDQLEETFRKLDESDSNNEHLRKEMETLLTNNYDLTENFKETLQKERSQRLQAEERAQALEHQLLNVNHQMQSKDNILRQHSQSIQILKNKGQSLLEKLKYLQQKHQHQNVALNNSVIQSRRLEELLKRERAEKQVLIESVQEGQDRRCQLQDQLKKLQKELTQMKGNKLKLQKERQVIQSRSRNELELMQRAFQELGKSSITRKTWFE